MMKTYLKSTGLLLGGVFLLGYILNVAQAIIAREPLLPLLTGWMMVTQFAMALIFFASAFVHQMQWAQPLTFILMTPLGMIESRESFYGLGAFVIGVLFLFRMGFYEKRRVLRLVLSLAYLYAVELFFAITQHASDWTSAFMPVFFITAFLIMLYLAYQEKIMVYLKEPKEKLSLANRGLSAAERTYVLALVGGMGPKEIAAEYEVSDSTVRNTIARSYQKLGVHDRSGLAALSEKYEVLE